MDITKLAALARLKLSKEEEKNFSKDFEGILAYVDQIQKVQVQVQVEEGALSSQDETDLLNVMRDDEEINPSGQNTEALLSLSPERDGNYIKVKKIL